MAPTNTKAPKVPDEQEVVNDGTGRTVLPTDVEGVAYKYGVTRDEAAQIIADTGTATDDKKLQAAADEVRGSRTVFKQGWVEEPAGVAVPQGLGPTVATPAPVVPPAPEKLDPFAPADDEPTGAVLDTEVRHNEQAVELADQYADQAQATVEAVDEAVDQANENS